MIGIGDDEKGTKDGRIICANNGSRLVRTGVLYASQSECLNNGMGEDRSTRYAYV